MSLWYRSSATWLWRKTTTKLCEGEVPFNFRKRCPCWQDQPRRTKISCIPIRQTKISVIDEVIVYQMVVTSPPLPPMRINSGTFHLSFSGIKILAVTFSNINYHHVQASFVTYLPNICCSWVSNFPVAAVDSRWGLAVMEKSRNC